MYTEGWPTPKKNGLLLSAIHSRVGGITPTAPDDKHKGQAQSGLDGAFRVASSAIRGQTWYVDGRQAARVSAARDLSFCQLSRLNYTPGCSNSSLQPRGSTRMNNRCNGHDCVQLAFIRSASKLQDHPGRSTGALSPCSWIQTNDQRSFASTPNHGPPFQI